MARAAHEHYYLRTEHFFLSRSANIQWSMWVWAPIHTLSEPQQTNYRIRAVACSVKHLVPSNLLWLNHDKCVMKKLVWTCAFVHCSGLQVHCVCIWFEKKFISPQSKTENQVQFDATIWVWEKNSTNRHLCK